MGLWDEMEIAPDQCYRWSVGPLALYLKRISDELMIAFDRSPECNLDRPDRPLDVFEGPEPASLEWMRWITGDSAGRIRIIPSLPDRPVVVRPELRVKIPSGQEALFFVSIPVWVKVLACAGRSLVLCEEASVILSNIWFGDAVSGQLCYSLRSRARRRTDDSQVQYHRAVCPVRIHNKSPLQLDIERFCVHVEYLKIYYSSRQLWTNEINMRFKNEGGAGEVDYSQAAPAFEYVDGVLCGARTPIRRTLLQRSIGSFGFPVGQ